MLEIPAGGYYNIRRAVILARKTQDFTAIKPHDRFLVSENRSAEGMIAKYSLGEKIVYQFSGGILYIADLLEYDLLFLLDIGRFEEGVVD